MSAVVHLSAWRVSVDVNTTTYADRTPPLSVAEAAEYLNVTEHFVRRLVRERRIAFVKLGRHVRFAPADLDAFIEQGRREARA